MKKEKDQSFDNIMHKFAKNIYGSTKGQLRHEILLEQMQKYINLRAGPLNIIDVGGGTGIMTKAMLELGHHVCFNDVSADAIAYAKNALEGFEHLTFNHNNLSDMQSADKYDLVICHAVLEWLAEPLAALSKLCDLTNSGGHISLSFFNQDAHRFGNILYGNFDYVATGMVNKNTVRLNPKQGLSPKDVLARLDSLPVTMIASSGIRCFHDYLKDREKQQQEYAQIKTFEQRYCEQEPYKWLGKYFHLILRVD